MRRSRIELKDGTTTDLFKLPEIVSKVVGSMLAIRNPETMSPAVSAQDFSIECLDLITQIYSPNKKEIKPTQMEKPVFKEFVQRCSQTFHDLKSNDAMLFTYRHPNKGFIRGKFDLKTPTEIIMKVNGQGKDAIINRIDKFTGRVNQHSSVLGIEKRDLLIHRK